MKEITVDELIQPKVQFVTGNDAIVYGALLANCRFFAGYPITPATEILESMTQYLPLLKEGYCIQMEDEIGSIGAIIGASWNNVRTMTATSGPGFSLMQENLGYACMTETPCVIVDVQRTGPSTGQPTKPAQGDVMESRWGTHGDHNIIVLYPNSVQEALWTTIRAFNLADKYRTPVVLLSDAAIAHTRERLEIPLEKEVEIIKRIPVTIDKSKYHPFRTGYSVPSKVPEMDRFGNKYHTYLTGLTHDWKAYPETNSAEVHEKLVRRLYEKIDDNRHDIIKYEEKYLEDADIVIVCYGIASRTVYSAVETAREKGFKVGLFRPITLWPFPEDKIYDISLDIDKFLVIEMNLGQIYHSVLEYSKGNCQVESLFTLGGQLPREKEILKKIRKR
ncbi:MAG: 2-oxoacid:acceptor oxidoreductase subunit alpha [Candidatus Lokiarchaeota archaeon]|nr:2-oxoacid:acceptor oxidoreductase subunit alpha [Candidatus Lokiarchaeota archaeon]MBD3198891.1 2-oxoacid:acceptor oxidoreductase subunit alpha [Candidatus Lokiarchaeota archaeon]